MHKTAIRLLSGTSLEGPARRTYAFGRRHIPAKLLSPEAAKSLAYDRMTLNIASQTLANGGSSIDIGAHEGKILQSLVKFSFGPHWAFEPMPAFAERLRRRFPGVNVNEAALGDSSGKVEFRYLPHASAYSSLLNRPEIEQGQVVRQLYVKLCKLDDCIPQTAQVKFVKIDVEGVEAAVLRGGRLLLSRCKPVTIFECAPASLPECVAALEGTGLRISFLADFMAGIQRSTDEIVRIGRERGEYYYVAAPERH